MEGCDCDAAAPISKIEDIVRDETNSCVCTWVYISVAAMLSRSLNG